MSNMEGPTNFNDREITINDQTDSVAITAVKIDKVDEPRNIISEPATSDAIYTSNTAQRGNIQPNWIQTEPSTSITQPNLNWLNTIPSLSSYQSPIISTLPLFTTISSNAPSHVNLSSNVSNPMQQQQQPSHFYIPNVQQQSSHFQIPNVQQQPPMQSHSYQTPPNYTVIDSRVLTELLAQNREFIIQNQQMLQTLSQLVQQLSLQGKPKKMIPLGKYRLEDGETFPQFLTRFEEYVKN